MTDYDFTSFVATPWSLAACGAILVVAMLALRLLRAQWARHRVDGATRGREGAVLGIATLAALLVVAGVHAQLEKAARATRLQAELEQRHAQAAELRQQLEAQVGRIRSLLAERTVHHIEQQRLEQAHDELARFAALKDPRISQMLALIDTERAVRVLVEQSMRETAPDKLHAIYRQLAERVPDNAHYREQAARLASVAAGPATAPSGSLK